MLLSPELLMCPTATACCCVADADVDATSACDLTDEAVWRGAEVDSCCLPAEVAGCSNSSSNPGESDTCRPAWLPAACAKGVRQRPSCEPSPPENRGTMMTQHDCTNCQLSTSLRQLWLYLSSLSYVIPFVLDPPLSWLYQHNPLLPAPGQLSDAHRG